MRIIPREVPETGKPAEIVRSGPSYMPRSRPPYDEEFKRRIVELHRSGRSVLSLCREFEPSEMTIRTWIKQAQLDAGERDDGLTTEERNRPHVTQFIVDHADPVNPVSAGCLLAATVWRKTVGGAGKVGGAVVVRADLAYAQSARHERT